MVKIAIKDVAGVRIAQMMKSLMDMTAFFKALGDMELSDTKQRFVEQVDPYGKKWATPFTLRKGIGPETARGATSQMSADQRWNYVMSSNYKATPPGYRFFRKSSGDKILRDTSTLFNSIGRAYSKDYVVIGTNVEYAEQHQFGLGSKKRRPFLGINEQTYANVDSLIYKILGIKK